MIINGDDVFTDAMPEEELQKEFGITDKDASSFGWHIWKELIHIERIDNKFTDQNIDLEVSVGEELREIRVGDRARLDGEPYPDRLTHTHDGIPIHYRFIFRKDRDHEDRAE